MNNVEESVCCIICSKSEKEGFHILEQFLCYECEQEILTTDVKDPKYAYFVTQLKSLLCEPLV